MDHQKSLSPSDLFNIIPSGFRASLVAQLVKNLPAMWETWIGRIPWRWERLPTPVFFLGEFHGLYSPWGLKEWDTTEPLSLHFRLHPCCCKQQDLILFMAE